LEEAKRIQALIIDMNVLISPLVRSEGITRVSVTIPLHDDNHKAMAPAEVIQELKEHLPHICSKTGIAKPHLEKALDQLLVDQLVGVQIICARRSGSFSAPSGL
jgi:predicted nucleic acid-binding protein